MKKTKKLKNNYTTKNNINIYLYKTNNYKVTDFCELVANQDLESATLLLKTDGYLNILKDTFQIQKCLKNNIKIISYTTKKEDELKHSFTILKCL